MEFKFSAREISQGSVVCASSLSVKLRCWPFKLGTSRCSPPASKRVRTLQAVKGSSQKRFGSEGQAWRVLKRRACQTSCNGFTAISIYCNVISFTRFTRKMQEIQMNRGKSEKKMQELCQKPQKIQK